MLGTTGGTYYVTERASVNIADLDASLPMVVNAFLAD